MSPALVAECLPEYAAVGICTAEERVPELMPLEAALLSPRAVDRRRADFTRGRAAAHRALAALGQPDAPIGRGQRGEPLWPAGVVGSITHASGVAIAAVADCRDITGLGIDLEFVYPSRLTSIASYVCLPDELVWIEQPGADSDRFVRLVMVFTAKEAVYKALYPIMQMVLEFADVRIEWRSLTAFQGILQRPAGPYQSGLLVAGRCCVQNARVFSAAWLP